MSPGQWLRAWVRGTKQSILGTVSGQPAPWQGPEAQGQGEEVATGGVGSSHPRPYLSYVTLIWWGDFILGSTCQAVQFVNKSQRTDLSRKRLPPKARFISWCARTRAHSCIYVHTWAHMYTHVLAHVREL